MEFHQILHVAFNFALNENIIFVCFLRVSFKMTYFYCWNFESDILVKKSVHNQLEESIDHFD